MNKAELINLVAAKAKVTKKNAEAVVSVTLDAIVDVVASGEKVALVGFGTFEARQRQARRGRNPKTGEEVLIDASTVPGFSAGKFFKEKINR